VTHRAGFSDDEETEVQKTVVYVRYGTAVAVLDGHDAEPEPESLGKSEKDRCCEDG
jgi:hypothetical protein